MLCSKPICSFNRARRDEAENAYTLGPCSRSRQRSTIRRRPLGIAIEDRPVYVVEPGDAMRPEEFGQKAIRFSAMMPSVVVSGQRTGSVPPGFRRVRAHKALPSPHRPRGARRNRASGAVLVEQRERHARRTRGKSRRVLRSSPLFPPASPARSQAASPIHSSAAANADKSHQIDRQAAPRQRSWHIRHSFPSSHGIDPS